MFLVRCLPLSFFCLYHHNMAIYVRDKMECSRPCSNLSGALFMHFCANICVFLNICLTSEGESCIIVATQQIAGA
jgi:hypothetical protein